MRKVQPAQLAQGTSGRPKLCRWSTISTEQHAPCTPRVQVTRVMGQATASDGTVGKPEARPDALPEGTDPGGERTSSAWARGPGRPDRGCCHHPDGRRRRFRPTEAVLGV